MVAEFAWAKAFWRMVAALPEHPQQRWQLDHDRYAAACESLGMPVLRVKPVSGWASSWNEQFEGEFIEISKRYDSFWASATIYHELMHGVQRRRYSDLTEFIDAYDDAIPLKPARERGTWLWIKDAQVGNRFERECLRAQNRVFTHGLLTTATVSP